MISPLAGMAHGNTVERASLVSVLNWARSGEEKRRAAFLVAAKEGVPCSRGGWRSHD
jgi:hypothetical protein